MSAVVLDFPPSTPRKYLMQHQPAEGRFRAGLPAPHKTLLDVVQTRVAPIRQARHPPQLGMTAKVRRTEVVLLHDHVPTSARFQLDPGGQTKAESWPPR